MIFGSLINQKSDIVTVKDEVDVSLGLLNFSCKLFGGKHIPNTVLHNISSIDQYNLAIDENIIYVSFFGQVTSSTRGR